MEKLYICKRYNIKKINAFIIVIKAVIEGITKSHCKKIAKFEGYTKKKYIFIMNRSRGALKSPNCKEIFYYHNKTKNHSIENFLLNGGRNVIFLDTSYAKYFVIPGKKYLGECPYSVFLNILAKTQLSITDLNISNIKILDNYLDWMEYNSDSKISVRQDLFEKLKYKEKKLLQIWGKSYKFLIAKELTEEKRRINKFLKSYKDDTSFIRKITEKYDFMDKDILFSGKTSHLRGEELLLIIKDVVTGKQEEVTIPLWEIEV